MECIENYLSGKNPKKNRDAQVVCSSSQSSSVLSSRCCKTKKSHPWNTNLGMKYAQDERLQKPTLLFPASTWNTSHGFSKQPERARLYSTFLDTQRQDPDCDCHSKMLQHIIINLKHRKTAVIHIPCVTHIMATHKTREIVVKITRLTSCSELKSTYF